VHRSADRRIVRQSRTFGRPKVEIVELGHSRDRARWPFTGDLPELNRDWRTG
jgi:hypothetical protein